MRYKMPSGRCHRYCAQGDIPGNTKPVQEPRIVSENDGVFTLLILRLHKKRSIAAWKSYGFIHNFGETVPAFLEVENSEII
jgi:hypothetical protein